MYHASLQASEDDGKNFSRASTTSAQFEEQDSFLTGSATTKIENEIIKLNAKHPEQSS